MEKQKKRGTSLKDKERHSQDHQTWSRRNFIQTLGMATGTGMALGSFSVSAMASGSFLPLMASSGAEDRVLVLIRLKGGNDGLNMIVPTFDYGTYQANRPTISIPQNQLLGLDDKFAIPNTMNSLMPLWNDGHMKVINSVGYDNHNLSHFSSSDIWNSADPSIEGNTDKSGWLGRYILDQNPDYLENLPDIPGAIKISSGSSIAYHNQDQIDLAVNFNTPDRLISIAENGFIYDTQNLPDNCYYGEQVGFLRSIMNVTFNYAPQISNAYMSTTNSVNYSNNELSRQLAIVARLIKGNLGTRLYMVTLDGFDTHENQNNNHPILMNNLSSAVSEFYADLAAGDKDNDVLAMSFSEFGRRINENSGGTDHGTAAPVMLFGPALNGNGILGEDPDMSDTDNNGNLKHDVDFRQIYASLLESWMCLDPSGVDAILGESFERLDLGFDCIGVSTNDVPLTQGIKHLARPNGAGGMVIEYHLDRPGNINVSIFSVMGQKVSTLVNGYQVAGQHEALYVNSYGAMSTMPLVYRIEAGGKVYSGKFIMTR